MLHCDADDAISERTMLGHAVFPLSCFDRNRLHPKQIRLGKAYRSWICHDINAGSPPTWRCRNIQVAEFQPAALVAMSGSFTLNTHWGCLADSRFSFGPANVILRLWFLCRQVQYNMAVGLGQSSAGQTLGLEGQPNRGFGTR